MSLRRLIPAALISFVLPALAVAESHGVDPATMDTTVSPCVDLFRYANGRWLDATPIPPAYAMVGVGREIADRNTQVVKRALENAGAGAEAAGDPAVLRVGAFYATCMDSERAEREGLKPIASLLARIDGIRTRADLQREIAALHDQDVRVGFRLAAQADPHHSDRVIGQIQQSGLGLPDRDDYIKTDTASAALRRDYQAHVARMLALGGASESDAPLQAAQVVALETALARASMTAVELRDPNALYHPMTVAQLSALAPSWNWAAYFAARGVTALAAAGALLDVSHPGFVKAFDAQLTSTPIAVWKAYLRWHLLRSTAPTLDTRLANESFSMITRLFGVRVQQPRWQRCSSASDNALGEAVGKAYVATAFSPEAKARMVEMVDHLQAALRDRIDALPWMTETTKVRARQKLAAVLKKIGYPDTWRDYSALAIDPDASYATNALRARAFEVHRQLQKIGGPTDRSEWQMTPATVNAYYDAPTNEICFPAGILQPPKFDLAADDASNYGSIGSVIGHELTHGFDDEGRQYDAHGNLTDWWTAEDATQFKSRADQIAKQFDGYVAVDSLHINGRLTLGENIADLGGLTIAYYAFEKSLEGKPRPGLIDGLTPEQRFFVAFAQGWRGKLRPEILRTIVKSNPHSPVPWRVNGVVVNMPEFQKAFGCLNGAPMSPLPERRHTIW